MSRTYTKRIVILLTPAERRALDAEAKRRKKPRAAILRESITKR